MEAIASLVWLIARRGGDERRLARADRFKFVAAVAVMVTFTTVMVFLGPLYGYLYMLAGANFFFHLAVPLAAALEIVLLTDFSFSRKDDCLGMLQTFVYGVFYMGNNIINGIGEWPDTNDWYSFLTWGYPAGFLIFAVICGVSLLLGLAMRKAQKRVAAKQAAESSYNSNQYQ